MDGLKPLITGKNQLDHQTMVGLLECGGGLNEFSLEGISSTTQIVDQKIPNINRKHSKRWARTWLLRWMLRSIFVWINNKIYTTTSTPKPTRCYCQWVRHPPPDFPSSQEKWTAILTRVLKNGDILHVDDRHTNLKFALVLAGPTRKWSTWLPNIIKSMISLYVIFSTEII